MTKLAAVRLADADAERARDSHATAIGELQGLLAAGMRVIKDVRLADPSVVFVPHGLGHAPNVVLLSPPRAPDGVGVLAGLIYEVRGTVGGKPIDSSRYIVLVAGAFGTAVTVDVVVA